MRAFITLVLTLPLAIACGGSQKTTSPATDACAAAAQNTTRLMVAAIPDVAPGGAEELGAAFEQRCRADAWSVAATDCFAHAADQPAIAGCEPNLTRPQSDGLRDDLSVVLARHLNGASSGGAGYGGDAYGASAYGGDAYGG